MENNSTILPGPKTFSKKDVVSWLAGIGVVGVTTTAGLSSALGTCSQRIIREKVKQGLLKPIAADARQYVFTAESVADFLIKNPVYACRKERPKLEITQQRFNELAKHIQNLVHTHFRWMLSFSSLDDIVADVFEKICKSKAAWNAPDSVVLFRLLTKVARKYQSKQIEVPVNPTELEQIPDERDEYQMHNS